MVGKIIAFERVGDRRVKLHAPTTHGPGVLSVSQPVIADSKLCCSNLRGLVFESDDVNGGKVGLVS